ncbi:MAG: serine/threonine-protein phosphatase [Elainella sp. C42_A2020_010]|nr:serine/threonine-protein phosphatase [Elainella sp. C42_A2020_010]
MSRFAVKLQCPNPDCLYAENQVGQVTCDRCRSPLTYRYLWAVGRKAAQLAVGTLVDCRYAVVSPQVWLDTQPGLLPEAPAQIPDSALPYLRLHSQRLHLPGLFSIHPVDGSPIFLLENAPIDATGNLLPLLESAWPTAPVVRQLNWLWQMFQLWQALKPQGVSSSLLVAENLHVEGWRLRLREIVVDASDPVDPVESEALAHTNPAKARNPLVAMVMGTHADHAPQAAVLNPPESVAILPLTSSFLAARTAPPSLTDLANLWQLWAADAHPTIQEPLRQLCGLMRETPETEASMREIAARLNHLLLTEAVKLPLQIELAGATTTGTQRSHNEDACYPLVDGTKSLVPDIPGVGIICDGIGGHEGGEVASQIALRSLQLQLHTWRSELLAQPEPLPPTVIAEQLAGIVRVVNNLIAAQNDLQGREQRQRMGTTLVMAVQPPQTISTAPKGNTHELYLVHVGDSRAYWLTADRCQLLTVDDDVASREVRAGRCLYSQVYAQPNAAALTQALGTREADQISITVQRFVLDEDGILLLCSDGLSDNNLVEQFWASATRPVLQDQLTLKTALQEWITLANRQNGHDNASIVLMHCRLSDAPHLFNPNGKASLTKRSDATTADADLTESAKALLYDDETGTTQPPKAAVLPKQNPAPQKSFDGWLVGLGTAALMFLLGALGYAIWRELTPSGFQPNPTEPAEVQEE